MAVWHVFAHLITTITGRKEDALSLSPFYRLLLERVKKLAQSTTAHGQVRDPASNHSAGLPRKAERIKQCKAQLPTVADR